MARSDGSAADDVAGTDAREHRVALRACQVVGDPVGDAVRLGAEALRVHVAERRRARRSHLAPVRRRVVDRELLERRVRQPDGHRVVGRARHVPAVNDHALDQPQRADAVRRRAMDVDGLIRRIGDRLEERVDVGVRDRGRIDRDVDVLQAGGGRRRLSRQECRRRPPARDAGSRPRRSRASSARDTPRPRSRRRTRSWHRRA